MAICYVEDCIKKCVISILLKLGFQNASINCIDVLQDIMHQYISCLSTQIKFYSEACNRTDPSLVDLSLAFRDFRICADSLLEYCKCVGKIPFPDKELYTFPLRHSSLELGANDDEFLRKEKLGAEPWMPQLPKKVNADASLKRVSSEKEGIPAKILRLSSSEETSSPPPTSHLPSRYRMKGVTLTSDGVVAVRPGLEATSTLPPISSNRKQEVNKGEKEKKEKKGLESRVLATDRCHERHAEDVRVRPTKGGGKSRDAEVGADVKRMRGRPKIVRDSNDPKLKQKLDIVRKREEKVLLKQDKIRKAEAKAEKLRLRREEKIRRDRLKEEERKHLSHDEIQTDGIQKLVDFGVSSEKSSHVSDFSVAFLSDNASAREGATGEENVAVVRNVGNSSICVDVDTSFEEKWDVEKSKRKEYDKRHVEGSMLRRRTFEEVQQELERRERKEGERRRREHEEEEGMKREMEEKKRKEQEERKKKEQDERRKKEQDEKRKKEIEEKKRKEMEEKKRKELEEKKRKEQEERRKREHEERKLREQEERRKELEERRRREQEEREQREIERERREKERREKREREEREKKEKEEEERLWKAREEKKRLEREEKERLEREAFEKMEERERLERELRRQRDLSADEEDRRRRRLIQQLNDPMISPEDIKLHNPTPVVTFSDSDDDTQRSQLPVTLQRLMGHLQSTVLPTSDIHNIDSAATVASSSSLHAPSIHTDSPDAFHVAEGHSSTVDMTSFDASLKLSTVGKIHEHKELSKEERREKRRMRKETRKHKKKTKHSDRKHAEEKSADRVMTHEHIEMRTCSEDMLEIIPVTPTSASEVESASLNFYPDMSNRTNFPRSPDVVQCIRSPSPCNNETIVVDTSLSNPPPVEVPSGGTFGVQSLKLKLASFSDSVIEHEFSDRSEKKKKKKKDKKEKKSKKSRRDDGERPLKTLALDSSVDRLKMTLKFDGNIIQRNASVDDFVKLEDNEELNVVDVSLNDSNNQDEFDAPAATSTMSEKVAPLRLKIPAGEAEVQDEALPKPVSVLPKLRLKFDSTSGYVPNAIPIRPPAPRLTWEAPSADLAPDVLTRVNLPTISNVIPPLDDEDESPITELLDSDATEGYSTEFASTSSLDVTKESADVSSDVERLQGLEKRGRPSKKKRSILSNTGDVKLADEGNSGIILENLGTITESVEDGSVVHSLKDEYICPVCRKPDDGSPMISCDLCDDWYHWSCVGINSEPNTNDEWFCGRCAKHKVEFGIPENRRGAALIPLGSGALAKTRDLKKKSKKKDFLP